MTSEEKFKFYEAFGRTLHDYRKAKGLTLEALGKMLWKGRAAIHGIEQGRQQVYIHDYLEMQRILGLPDIPHIEQPPVNPKRPVISKEVLETLLQIKIT